MYDYGLCQSDQAVKTHVEVSGRAPVEPVEYRPGEELPLNDDVEDEDTPWPEEKRFPEGAMELDGDTPTSSESRSRRMVRRLSQKIADAAAMSPIMSLCTGESFRSKTLDEIQAASAHHVETGGVSEGNVPFPRSYEGHRVKVFDPYGPNRLCWDAFMLVLILVIAVVTPFELTFLEGADWGPGFRGDDATGIVFIFYLNRVSDVFFLADMVLTFNTSFFDQAAGRWVEELDTIARAYLRCWFWLDVLSLLPYSLMMASVKGAGLIRVVRLVRLMKLLKLAKQPRIMAKLRQYVTMPIKTQTLLKYFILLFFIIHWTACTLRLLTAYILGDCHPRDDDDEKCPKTYLSTTRRWEQGPWAAYAGAVIWSIGALSGESYMPANMEETILNTFILVVGMVVMAFLIGELGNILGNFDPVGNEFEQTVDNLNAYLEKNNFPQMLRLKLREYVLLSEPVFRERYYMNLMTSFSPTLRTTVANFQLSRDVSNVPFFSYAIQKGCGFDPGVIIEVAHGDLEETTWRRAKIVASVTTEFGYDVVYADGEVEQRVGGDRFRAVTDRHQKRVMAFMRVKRKFVGDVACGLDPMLFMPFESIVESQWSAVDSMHAPVYLITMGSCVVIKEKMNSMFDIRLKRFGSTIGADIASLLIGCPPGAPPRLRHYDAKAYTSVHIYKLSGETFLDILSQYNYRDMVTAIRYYGFCALLKMLLFRHQDSAAQKGVTLKQHLASIEAENPFKRRKPTVGAVQRDLRDVVNSLRLPDMVRDKLMSELHRNEIFTVEVARSLKASDWKELDVALGTRSLLVSRLDSFTHTIRMMTQSSETCGRPH